MNEFVVTEVIKPIHDAIVLYHPQEIDVDDVICHNDSLVVSLTGDEHQFIRLKITVNDQLVTTSVGICFASKQCFVEQFWSIDWFRLSQYSVILD